MARSLHKLADTAIRSKTIKPGRHNDGGGLYLNVSKTGNKSWVFLYKRDGAKWPREMGLGSYPDVSLSDARNLAADCRKQLAAGLDPIEERKRRAEPSFAEAADALIESLSSSWRNEKHRAQWKMTLGDTYCKTIRKKRVSQITLDDVLTVLKPVWASKPETATRLRGRIERVLDYARARGWRAGENPARWRGNLRDVLPSPKKLARGHHAAMPYQDIPAFMATLRANSSISARALEFLILTASRTGEVLGMRWEEVDLDGGVWTVPAERMKAHKIHRVPLPDRAIQILREMAEIKVGEYVFPGERKDAEGKQRPLSQMALAMALRRLDDGKYTAHGFRSSFRDWCGDATDFPRELAEAALAHKVGNEVELAYRRSDALDKRRGLMRAWDSYCGSNEAGRG